MYFTKYVKYMGKRVDIHRRRMSKNKKYIMEVYFNIERKVVTWKNQFY